MRSVTSPSVSLGTSKTRSTCLTPAFCAIWARISWRRMTLRFGFDMVWFLRGQGRGGGLQVIRCAAPAREMGAADHQSWVRQEG